MAGCRALLTLEMSVLMVMSFAMTPSQPAINGPLTGLRAAKMGVSSPCIGSDSMNLSAEFKKLMGFQKA